MRLTAPTPFGAGIPSRSSVLRRTRPHVVRDRAVVSEGVEHGLDRRRRGPRESELDHPPATLPTCCRYQLSTVMVPLSRLASMNSGIRADRPAARGDPLRPASPRLRSPRLQGATRCARLRRACDRPGGKGRPAAPGFAALAIAPRLAVMRIAVAQILSRHRPGRQPAAGAGLRRAGRRRRRAVGGVPGSDHVPVRGSAGADRRAGRRPMGRRCAPDRGRRGHHRDRGHVQPGRRRAGLQHAAGSGSSGSGQP